MPAVYKKYIELRSAVSAADSVAITEKKGSLNCLGYDTAMFQIIPVDGANPTVEVMVWSDVAESFISMNPKQTFAGLGADVPFEIVVSALDRTLWVKVNTIADGSVSIYGSAHITGKV